MKTKDIILKNAAGEDNTFIGILHDNGLIDISTFLSLFDAIVEITNQGISDKDVRVDIVKIYSYVLNSMINNLEENDLFKISNYNPDVARDIRERLNIAVESYFRGKKVREDIFDDDLRKCSESAPFD